MKSSRVRLRLVQSSAVYSSLVYSSPVLSNLKGVAKKTLSAAVITILLPFGGLSQLGSESMNVRKGISESKNICHYYVASKLKRL